MTDPGAAFAPARRERLAAIVRTRRAVRVEELRAALGVSLATIRRDLDELEGAGTLRRVHGGAVSVDQRPVEARFDAKAEVRATEKRSAPRLPTIRKRDPGNRVEEVPFLGVLSKTSQVPTES